MRCRICAVVNQKGGSGKTTTAMQLAGGLAALGLRVLVVDADESNNAMAWAGMAEEEAPFPATVVNLAGAGGRVAQEVRKHLANYDVIICDGPPSATSPVSQALTVIADLAIIPVQPTGNDDNSLGPMLRAIEQAVAMNPNLQTRILFNRVQPETVLHRQLMERMANRGVPVFQTQIKTRVAYTESMVQGNTALDLTDTKAQQEVQELTREVLEILKLKVEA